jgi:L-threonylcarbamoyladenylate synthase
VYGLAANALDPVAVEKIFIAKNRPSNNPLIVHISTTDDISKYVQHIPESAQVLAKAFWPGPLTMIFQKKNSIPDSVTAGDTTVAIRMPNHPLLQALLDIVPFPLAAPSANPFMYVSPVTAQHVLGHLTGRIPYILDGGRCQHGIESTIVSFDGEEVQILRAGAIDAKMMESVLGHEVRDTTANKHTKRAGMYMKHYSPHTPLVLGSYEERERFTGTLGYLTFSRVLDVSPNFQYQLSPTGDLSEAAHNLYHALHILDQSGCDTIVAELLPETGIGKALNERLRKAAYRGNI